MKTFRFVNSESMRGMLAFTIMFGAFAAFGCANRNGCMPGGAYGPYTGYPYAGQPNQPQIYASPMVGAPTVPGTGMPGQPTTYAAPPGYPTGYPAPGGLASGYNSAGYNAPPPATPGGQPVFGR